MRSKHAIANSAGDPHEPCSPLFHISDEPPRPSIDPTLGINVSPPDGSAAKHRIVALGDSLTHGFQSLAISKTHLAYPALIARELGWFEHYRYPTYDGYGGLPINVELTIREIERLFGQLNFAKEIFAVPWLLYWARHIRNWWDSQTDSDWGPDHPLNHDLAVFSYQVADVYVTTAKTVRQPIKPSKGGGRFAVSAPVDRAAVRVFDGATDNMTLADCVAAHADDGGIETLVVALGANNVLDVVINLDDTWAKLGDSVEVAAKANIWCPDRFDKDWAGLFDALEPIREKVAHLIVANVPHVTIVPLFAGVGKRIERDSPYFEYYTHAWLRDEFNVRKDPHLTGVQAREIDSAIDAYNETIQSSVMAARTKGLDWYLFDMCGLLDRLAYRRHLSPTTEGGTEASLPSWWSEIGPYVLPEALQKLSPPPDSRFLSADSSGRHEGGLFALDGVHPTTIGYGIVAQEIIRIMERAGVSFFAPGATNPRESPINVDFSQLLTFDSLLSSPPQTLTHDLRIIRWLNRFINLTESLRGRRRI